MALVPFSGRGLTLSLRAEKLERAEVVEDCRPIGGISLEPFLRHLRRTVGDVENRADRAACERQIDRHVIARLKRHLLIAISHCVH